MRNETYKEGVLIAVEETPDAPEALKRQAALEAIAARPLA